MKKHKCIVCGKTFEAKRRDVCFCGSNCRQKHSRKVRSFRTDALVVIRQIEYMESKRGEGRDYQLNEAFDEAMKLIKAKIVEV